MQRFSFFSCLLEESVLGFSVSEYLCQGELITLSQLTTHFSPRSSLLPFFPLPHPPSCPLCPTPHHPIQPPPSSATAQGKPLFLLQLRSAPLPDSSIFCPQSAISCADCALSCADCAISCSDDAISWTDGTISWTDGTISWTDTVHGVRSPQQGALGADLLHRCPRGSPAEHLRSVIARA